MERTEQNRLVRYLVSPYGLALISCGVFMAAVLFPPRLYSSVMEEPNYMFLDPASVWFFHEAGLDYVSCSPFRVETARLAAGQAALGSSESASK